MSKLMNRAAYVPAGSYPGATAKTHRGVIWDALQVQGFTDTARSTVTATAALTVAQCGVLTVDATAGNIVLTLPASGAAADEATFKVVRLDATANTVTIQKTGTDTVNGQPSIKVPPESNMHLQLPAGFTDWKILGQSAAQPAAQRHTAFTTAGTATAYTVTTAPGVVALVPNLRFRLRFHLASGVNPTVAFDGLAAKNLKVYDASGAKVAPALGALAVDMLSDVEYDGVDVVVLNPLPVAAAGASFRNKIINGSFPVNQRAYVSTTATASGVYMHDRWKATTAATAYTFVQAAVDTQITITAGTIAQVVEDKHVEGGVHTLSWTGTSQGRIAINGAATAGAYAASPITTAAATAGQTITVEFNAGTLGKVQLEPGTAATTFERRPYAIEYELCRRYRRRGYNWFSAYAPAGNYVGMSVPIDPPMRAAPTIVLTDDAATTSGFANGTNLGLVSAEGFVTYRQGIAGGFGTWAENYVATSEL